MSVAVATRGRPSMRSLRAGPLFFLLPALIPVVLFSVLPLAEGIYLGFTDAKAGLNVDLTPTWLDNYTRLLGNDLFWQSFQIGIIWAVTTTFLQYILGLGLAILMEQRLRFLWIVRTLALVPCSADPNVASIALGEADLRSDLGVTGEEGLLWARSRIVVAARAADLPAPAMSVYTRIDDPGGLAASCRRGRALGFIGRAAIHPRQLPVIAECFMPTEAETNAARELLDALAQANSTEHGVDVLPSGQFVDRAMIKGAERVIALAARRARAT